MEPVVYLTPSCGLKGKLIPKPTSTDDDEEQGRDVYNFLGIPYAEPPVGNLRFCDPKPVSLWNGIRSATEFGAVCPQDFDFQKLLPYPTPKPDSASEDCLFLNVWTPSLTSESSRLPVMVWIYGGGFLNGFSNIYDMSGLACFHNVVAVTINYRLASLGFLSVNDDSSANGNYGILDQIEALRWVQKYISHFGGDPDNVTILGESAGSISVSLLTISPMAKGLFRRAIAESGTVFSGDLGGQTAENAFKKMYAHMEKTIAGCPPPTAGGKEIIEFLRSQSAEELVCAFKGFQFTPVIDGRVFPSSTIELYESGQFNHCDLIVGCNSDEGEFVYEVIAKMMGLSDENLNEVIARAFLTNWIAMLWTFTNGQEVYKAIVDSYLLKDGVVHSPENLRKAITECIGDILFVFPTIMAASCHSRRHCKTYAYQFCHRPPYAKYPDYARADHGSEVFYALRMFSFGIAFNEEDLKLSRQMATYWTNFARTGDPNGRSLEKWPEYNEITREHLVIGLQPKASSKLKDDRADFWLIELPKIIAKL